jgi:small-conductance mechanosensitive channel
LFSQDTDAVSEASAIVKNIQENGFSLIQGVITTVLILALAVLLIVVVGVFFRELCSNLTLYGAKHFKSIKIKRYQILDHEQIQQGVLFSINLAKWIIYALILFLTVPTVFSIFPQTHDFATTLWGYFLAPVKKIVLGVIGYFPKLITIIVILFFVKYVLKMLKFFSDEIEKGRLTIKGFYADWSRPTYLLLKYMIYAFTIAIIYPYLPNSDTQVFQGVSLFVGLIISIGSSSAIGNLVAGLVITYMRPFQIGERIKIGENEGTVVEKSAFVVRILTDKKEYVTFPNITILTSNITNFSYSKETGNGLIIHTNITYNYTVEWRKIHELLISAAKKTQFIEQEPEPFVLQKALDDFYCVYEINAYTKEIAQIKLIYSELHKNIQDVFADAELDLTSPHYGIYKKED